MGITIPGTLIPGNIIAPIKEDTHSVARKKDRGPSKNGRLQKYDPIKLAAALLVKRMRSFAHLSTDLKNIAYDL